MEKFKVGDRVIFKRNFDAINPFIEKNAKILKNEKGTISSIINEYVIITMDKYHPGLIIYNNTVQFVKKENIINKYIRKIRWQK